MQRRDLRRRLFVPVLIITVGLLIAWWSAEQKNAEAQAARRFVRELCLDIAETHRRPGGDQFLATIRRRHRETFTTHATLEKLAAVLADEAARRDNLRVRIRPGDLPNPLGDGSATHTAAIAIDQNPAIVLRLQFHSDPARAKRIIGHTFPEHAVQDSPG